MTSRGHPHEDPRALNHDHPRVHDPVTSDPDARARATDGEFESELLRRLDRAITKTVGTAELAIVPAGRSVER